MSSSRLAYTALTPDFSDFAGAHHHKHASRLETSVVRSSSPCEVEIEDVPESSSRLCSTYARARTTIKSNTGLLLVVASQAFFSLMNVAVKKLNSIDPPVSALELIVVRMSITYICSISYMLYNNVNDPLLGPKDVRLLLIFRGFFGFFGLFGIYYSLQYLSLSDATVLTFLSPLCTAIAGALLLKENFTRKEAFAGLFSLVGVILIARPTFLFGDAAAIGASDEGLETGDQAEKGTPTERLIAVGIALVGVLGSTGAFTSIRAIGTRAHPLHTMTSFSMQCVIVSTAGMIVTRTPVIVPTHLEWLALLIMIGVFGFVAQVLLTMGLQRETAGRGAMAIYTQVVFATVLERVFFHTMPSALSVVGTIIIIFSALYVALTKENERPQKSNTINLRHIDEESLEEGLLESREEAGKDDAHQNESKSTEKLDEPEH